MVPVCKDHEKARWIGKRVGVTFDHKTLESGKVRSVTNGLATVRLDESIELPEQYGGGWCVEIDRELDELVMWPDA